MVSRAAGSPEPRWEIRDWLAAAGLFLATAGVVLWQNAHVAVLFDSSYILNTAERISLGQMPYRDFPLAHAPLTFLIQAAIIRLTGRVFFHHVLYTGLVGGLGTVLAWRIALRSLRGRVRVAWPVALLVAAPLCVLGIYCIVPNPEYDCDCGFWILVAVWMVQRLDAETSPRFGFAAGAALCVPVFFKQNMGLPFLAATGGAILLLLGARCLSRPRVLTEGADQPFALKGHGFSHAEGEANVDEALAAEGMRTIESTSPQGLKPDLLSSLRVAQLKPRPFKAKGSLTQTSSAADSSGPEASVLLAVVAGVCVTLGAAMLALHWTAGIGNYLHWTVEYAGQRRLPGFSLMLGVYRDPSLLWTLPCVAVGLVLLWVSHPPRTLVARRMESRFAWARVAAFALMAAPFLFTLASLFLYDDADERGDSLLALWPLLLVLAAALAVANIVRPRGETSLRAFLPLVLLAAIHGTFLSQQLWGSTYAIWPLLVLLVAEMLAFLPGSKVVGNVASERLDWAANGGPDLISGTPESSGAKEAAEKGQGLKAEPEEHSSGAKSRVDLTTFAARLKSCPDTRPLSLSARMSPTTTCKSRSTFLSPMRGLKPPPPSGSPRSASDLAATGSGAALVMAAVVSVTLLVCGGFYTASEERLSYAYLPDGPAAHSAFPELVGLATPGPYLPEIDELLRYAQANIPFDDGIVLVPGEEPFYFATGRVPRFPVPFFDPTIDPYPPEEIAALVRSRNIRWLIVKTDVQTKEDPTPQREAMLKLLMSEFTLSARLHGYDVYRRSRDLGM